MNRIYHDINILASDIFRIAGPDSIYEFQAIDKDKRNAIVMTSSQLDELDSLKNHSLTIDELLVELKRTTSRDRKIPLQDYKDNKQARDEIDRIHCYEFSNNLDIIRIDDRDWPEIRDERYLSKIIQKYFIMENNRSDPAFITTNPTKFIKLMDRGLRVEDPVFLRADARIVNNGFILGDDNLYQKLKITDVPIEEAEDMLGMPIYSSQFVYFPSKEYGYEYARVIGRLNYTSFGEPIFMENKKLHLLNPSEYSRMIFHRGKRKDNLWGYKPGDMRQYIALQYALLDPDKIVVFICGKQGTGKSVLSYIAAIDQILLYKKDSFDDIDSFKHQYIDDFDHDINNFSYHQNKKKKKNMHNSDIQKKINILERMERLMREGKIDPPRYNRVYLLKSDEYMGKRDADIGALPGNLFNKQKPTLESLIEIHEDTELNKYVSFYDLILHPLVRNEFGGPRKDPNVLFPIAGIASLPYDHEAVKVIPSIFFRGMTVRKSIMLIDEAQNYTPYEIKTLIQRLGRDSKIIIIGDPPQLDNPNKSRTHNVNGLTYSIKHFIDQDYVALINLDQHYRSIASLHADSMKVYSE